MTAMSPPVTPLPATYLHGARLRWSDAPHEVAAWLTGALGAPVTGADDRSGGMSVGVATVLTLGDGRRVFVKAVDGGHNPRGYEMYRHEADRATRLPRSPLIPALLADAAIDTDAGPWAALVFEAANGTAVDHPWRDADLVRVLDAWHELTPALHADAGDLASAELSEFLGRWRVVVDDPDDTWHPLLTDGPTGRRWADRLAAMSAAVDGGDGGDGAEAAPVLSHIDLRADNILIGEPSETSPAGVWFADWAHPGLAAPWADPAILFADVVGSGADRADGGGIDVVERWRTHPATAPYDVERLLTVVVGLAVALHVGAQRPPNGLFPHQRGWERAMADGMLGFAVRHRR